MSQYAALKETSVPLRRRVRLTRDTYLSNRQYASANEGRTFSAVYLQITELRAWSPSFRRSAGSEVSCLIAAANAGASPTGIISAPPSKTISGTAAIGVTMDGMPAAIASSREFGNPSPWEGNKNTSL